MTDEAGRIEVSGQHRMVLSDLRHLWRLGHIVQDRNGDEVADAVDLSFVLTADPSNAEVVAAANIAARAAFETTALDLPLSRGTGAGHVVVIGRGAFKQAGLRELPDSGPLPRGHGSVRFQAADPTTGRCHLFLAADDDSGLSGAARFVAELLEGDVRAIDLAIVAAGRNTDDVMVVGCVVDGSGRPSRVEFQLAGGGQLVSLETAVRDLSPVEYAGEARSAAEGDLAALYEAGGPFAGAGVHPLAGQEGIVLSPFGAGSAATIDLAARLALEATAVRLPLAVLPEAFGFDLLTGKANGGGETRIPVLIGSDHPLVTFLVRRGRLSRLDLAAGEGVVEVVRSAFERAGGPVPAIVVRGADPAGLDAALRRLAAGLPHLDERGKGRPTIGEVAEEVRDIVNTISPAGQAAAGMCLLDELAGVIRGQAVDEVQVELALDRADPALGCLLEEWAKVAFPSARISARLMNRDVRGASPGQHDVTGISAEFVLPREVEAFWALFRGEVLAKLSTDATAPFAMKAALSESPSVRDAIAVQVRAEIADAAPHLRAADVEIGCAYKPGFAWITETVAAGLERLGVDRVEIRARSHGPPAEWSHQTMFTATRWLHEIFPADVVLARKLGLDLSAIRLRVVPEAKETYEVVAHRSEREVFRRNFSPRLNLQPLITLFPDYEKVQVTTGGITATLGGQTLIDARIETDMEAFWRYYHEETLPRLHEYVMRLTQGDPKPADIPLFAELRVEARLSEPDFKIGVAEEVISAIDALHEEIYLSTRRFLEVTGQRLGNPPLTYPGRIVPVVRATEPGELQQCRILFSGFESLRPHARLRWRVSGVLREQSLPIPVQTVERPRVVEITSQAGAPGLSSLTLEVPTDPRVDDRRRLWTMSHLPGKDIGWDRISASQLERRCAWLRTIASKGLYRDALAYTALGEIRVAARDGESAPQVFPPIPSRRGAPPADIRNHAHRVRSGGRRLVQWFAPIPPAESAAILAEMAAFEEATVYKVGESYLGRDVWAVDLVEPIAASHVSRLKLSTTKPTIVFSARQHANEVSSTSHVLRLAELLLTDPDRRAFLRRVNVVVQPILNPDGAELVAELGTITPNLLLHAGYFGALGGDVGYGHPGDNPVMPESKVRPKLWRWWLPDIVMNPHGQPAHEWVMPFSEYVGWGVSRNKVVRDFWAPRGWFVPDAAHLRGPDYSAHRKAALEIFDRIITGQNADAEAVERTAYLRNLYARYTVEIDPEVFRLHIVDGVTILGNPLGGDRGDPVRAKHYWMFNYPDITIWQGTTEAVDEGIFGETLSSVAGQGLRWGLAVVEYLAEAHHEIRRTHRRDRDGATLSMCRLRPGTLETQPERLAALERQFFPI